MQKIRVLVADDHAIVRMGLVALIESQVDMQIVGEAEDGAEAVSKVSKLKPDIVLMDVMMPVMDGIEATRRISPTRVLALTTSAVSDDIASVLKAGAWGVVMKSEANQKLLAAIRSVARGEKVESKAANEVLGQNPPAGRLSPRQLEILEAVSRGLTNNEIANMLGVSPESVKDRVNLCCQKLGAANRTEAVAIAYRRHLLK